eukprot:4631334-Amphidinium_carterae.1
MLRCSTTFDVILLSHSISPENLYPLLFLFRSCGSVVGAGFQEQCEQERRGSGSTGGDTKGADCRTGGSCDGAGSALLT